MAIKDDKEELGVVNDKTVNASNTGQNTASNSGYTPPTYKQSTPFTTPASGLYQTAKDAYLQHNIKGAANIERNANTVNNMTGNQEANSYQYAGALDDRDYSAEGNSAMASGIGAGVVGAIASARANKSANTAGYSQYGNDATQQAMNNYAANGGFQYSDPYGYQDMIAGMNPGIASALKDYAGSTYADYRNGPEYQNLSDLYRQRGQLAMEDTLGTASQMSGGLDSSYATTAAAQAYNGYMSNLEQAAQSAYQQQLSNKAAQLNAQMGYQSQLAGLDNTLYNREYQNSRDKTNDYLTAWELFDNSAYRNKALSQEQSQWEGNMAYNIWDANNTNQYRYDSLAQDYDLGIRGLDNNLQAAAISANTTLAGQANQYAIAGMNNATDLQIAQMNNDTKLNTSGSSSTGTNNNNAAAKIAWQAYQDGDEESLKKYYELMGITPKTNPTNIDNKKQHPS